MEVSRELWSRSHIPLTETINYSHFPWHNAQKYNSHVQMRLRSLMSKSAKTLAIHQKHASLYAIQLQKSKNEYHWKNMHLVLQKPPKGSVSSLKSSPTLKFLLLLPSMLVWQTFVAFHFKSLHTLRKLLPRKCLDKSPFLWFKQEHH